MIHLCRNNVSFLVTSQILSFTISYAFAGLSHEEIRCHSGDIANLTFLMSNNVSPITCHVTQSEVTLVIQFCLTE